jgi:glycosyltransferase involved in cell wall biosynthesis
LNQKQKIKIISPNLSENCLGRALVFAELLKNELDVEILGLASSSALWSPALSSSIQLTPFYHRRIWSTWTAAAKLRSLIRDEPVIISKPLLQSLGVAIMAGVDPNRAILDIDDWELAGIEPPKTPRDYALRLGGMIKLKDSSRTAVKLMETVVRRFPHRIVSNTWLQRRFGGTILHHVRDTDALDPTKVSGESRRAALNLGDRVWVGFIGTIRPHKGIADLIDALGLITGPKAPGLLLCGVNRRDPVAATACDHAISTLGKSRLRVVEQFPLNELGEYLAACDIISIPSGHHPASKGQIPAKLFDAMSMARPIVATRCSDMPSILERCGITVEPSAPTEIAAAIRTLAADANLRRRLGLKARKKAVELYSYAAGRRTLWQKLESIGVCRTAQVERNVSN